MSIWDTKYCIKQWRRMNATNRIMKEVQRASNWKQERESKKRERDMQVLMEKRREDNRMYYQEIYKKNKW
jgi:hypothetical protein